MLLHVRATHDNNCKICCTRGALDSSNLSPGEDCSLHDLSRCFKCLQPLCQVNYAAHSKRPV
jgi:hypothetical protein